VIVGQDNAYLPLVAHACLMASLPRLDRGGAARSSVA
jgi:hypothetical protein